MKVQYVVYTLVGIVLVLAALSFLTVWMEKKGHDTRYDERQKIARGDAYRFSFWIGFVLLLGFLVYLVHCVEHEPVVEPYLLLFIGIMVQAMAFHCYCLVTHSALLFSEKPTISIIGYGLMGIFDLLSFFTRDVPEVMPLTGKGTSVWLNLLMGVIFLALGIMHLISALMKEKE